MRGGTTDGSTGGGEFSRGLALRRVLSRRCPQCAEGALFRAYARLHERCSVCALVYRREPGAMTGSMYLSAATSSVFAMAVALVLFFGTDWEALTSLVVAVPIVLVFSLAFLPVSQALWVGVEYATDWNQGERWARPRT